MVVSTIILHLPMSSYPNIVTLTFQIEPVQVIFYAGDFVRQMEDIQRGNLDVAVVTSSFLEEFYPAYVTSGIFRFHLVTTPMFQGQPYPFLTSTEVVPGYALAAAAHISPTIREQIYQALSKLNATHPLSVAAGITGFVAHSSYELPRTVALKVGSIQAALDGTIVIDLERCWKPLNGR